MGPFEWCGVNNEWKMLSNDVAVLLSAAGSARAGHARAAFLVSTNGKWNLEMLNKTTNKREAIQPFVEVSLDKTTLI